MPMCSGIEWRGLRVRYARAQPLRVSLCPYPGLVPLLENVCELRSQWQTPEYRGNRGQMIRSFMDIIWALQSTGGNMQRYDLKRM